MQQFFIDYGLWLLIALLAVISVVFLLTARRGQKDIATHAAPQTAEPREAVPVAAAIAASDAPVISDEVLPKAEPNATAPAAAAIAEPDSRIETVVPAVPEPAPVAAAGGAQGDNLLKMKGVGPKLNQLLIELGVTRYAQIAAWSDADIAAVDAKLGNFKGRPVRDQWIDQAKYLAAGDTAGFEAKYGKL